MKGLYNAILYILILSLFATESFSMGNLRYLERTFVNRSVSAAYHSTRPVLGFSNYNYEPQANLKAAANRLSELESNDKKLQSYIYLIHLDNLKDEIKALSIKPSMQVCLQDSMYTTGITSTEFVPFLFVYSFFYQYGENRKQKKKLLTHIEKLLDEA